MEIKNGKQALKFKLASNEIFNLETKKSLVSYKGNNTHASLNLIEKNHLNDFLIQKPSKLRSKRAPNDKTLVEATLKSDYTYWLSQEDIADIARIEYHSYRGIEGSNARFEVTGSLFQLYNELKAFQSNIQITQLNTARLTLIVNLEQAHWVSLVIAYQHGNYIAYYIDSKNKLIPYEYSNMLFETFQIIPYSLSPGCVQQQDPYNCGLWALENSFHLNQMLDQNQSLNWLTAQLKKPHNKEYFKAKRESFSKQLRKDPIWDQRHPLFLQDLNAQKKLQRLHTIPSTSDFEPKLKQLKTTTPKEKEKVINLLETFVENFMSVFIKKLSVYHLLSKEESLTEDALKTELKTGLTGALLGVGISLSLVGSIPSLVASLRALSGKYYISKIKAQKITKIFSEFKTNYLSSILSEAAVTIFHCFESQFMQITDKAGDKVAMEKLAEDAIGRMLNAIVDYSDTNKLIITKELIEKAVLKGPSEKFFDPNVKRARLRISGYIIQNKNGDQINTANLYEKMGLVELNLNGLPRKFYVPEKYPSSKYGYRLLFDWEKEANGELKKNLQERYIIKEFFLTEDNDHIISRNYHYVLDTLSNQLETQRILKQLENRNHPSTINKKYGDEKPIYFNLIKTVKNFSGRGEILKTLHKILLSERTIAIVPAWSTLSISSSSDSHSPQTSSGSQLLITGLGGIGKTQLALRYAELYAQEYEHNVLWINAENKENLAYSFFQLAKKLQIASQDQYVQAKTLEEITEEIYEYFSDKKSLFIFDNVENYRALEAYLPKVIPGNKPTLLITSRYTNWSNIATVLPLAVFTDQETEELISKSLDLPNNTLYENIKELNQLLQGLPLALQQAVAYIQLKKNTESHFSISNYIELYKKKQQQLLNFNFFDYSNDPYLKTVFTTWLITLDKIKTYPIGNLAIDTLHIMAYLYPDYISAEKLIYLADIHPDFKSDNLDTIIHLLNSYSMLNTKDVQKSRYTIHRLVQQVIRLHVENNPSTFIKTIENIQSLFDYWNLYYKEDNETRFHYLHFLIYMLKHNDLIPILGEHPEKKFFDTLLLQKVKHFQYFIELTYFKFPKENFLRFIGDALAYYMKLGEFVYLREILNYLEKKWSKKLFSMENIKYITEHIHSIKNPQFKLIRFSPIPAKQANQREAITLLYNFKEKIFGEKHILYNNCPSHSLKRSICLSKTDQDKLDKFKLTNQQSIKTHFKKVGEISGYINSALMTKDTLSALLQGQFADVAINFGLITSSILSGKISNRLLTQGKNLAKDVSLIEKNLNLENKKALHILLNDEVLSVGKRQFLGKVMQAASPFVAKITDIFFIYNLKKEIQAYNKGDRSTLPTIVSNSIILSIDGIQAGIEGAELLDMIIEISAFTGPIGEWISLLTLVSTEAYMAKQHVEAIEKYVHLSRGEKIFEFLLSMLHQAPLEYLQLKANNGQRVEQVIRFLKNTTDIQRYIFPSFHFAEDLCGIRKVFLNAEIKFTPDESNPDEPAEGDLFCLSASPPPYTALNESIKPKYLCHKALGVGYTLNRTDNVTLINLGEGDDEVIAFSDSPTLFSVQNGKKWYQGSDSGNVFDLQGNHITGLIQGGAGLDVLILDNFYPKNSNYVLLDELGLLCGKNYSSIHSVPPLCLSDELSLKINKIDQIFGRRHEPDIFYLNSYTHQIDGYGGKNTEQLDSFFVTEHSPENITFILRNNTLILFSSRTKTHTIEYRIPANEVGKTRIQTHFNESIQHRFFFECFLKDVDSLTINNNRVHISVLNSRNRDKETFSITISVDSINSENNQTKNTPEILKNNHFSFKDVEIKAIINEHLYVKEITSNNKTVDENISFFTELANRLKKALSIQLANNITLLIGREKKHEIFYINNLFKNYVVGNGGENILIPFLPLKNIVFPLHEITLSEISKDSNLNEQEESINSLDLREIIKRYQQIHPKVMVASHVFSEATDLILTLSNAIYSPSNPNAYGLASFDPWATIRLKNALLDDNNWHQKLDIFLDSFPRNIVPIDNEVWTLTAAPLIFMDDKKIIVLTNQDIDEGIEVHILKNIGTFAFLRNEADLMITNALSHPTDYCTMICSQFYQLSEMKKKMISATLSFFDKIIPLRSYQEEINHAIHLSKLTFNATTPINSFFLSSIANQNQKPQQTLRRKRQVDPNEKQLINPLSRSESPNKTLWSEDDQIKHPLQLIRNHEEDRILAIADDYLEKYDHAYAKNKPYYSKKNLTRKRIKNKKINSLMSSQEKATPIEKKHSSKQKNNNYFKQINPNRLTQDKLTLTTNSKTENRLRIPFLSKSKTTKPKEISLKPFNFNKKINSLLGIKPTYPQEKIKFATKAIASYPAYQQNQSGSKKSKPYPVSSYIAPPNLHSTLIFLDFILRKSPQNPVSSIFFNKKLNKTLKRIETKKDRIKSKIFGIQKLQ